VIEGHGFKTVLDRVHVESRLTIFTDVPYVLDSREFESEKEEEL
jgi:hypothetical protein